MTEQTHQGGCQCGAVRFTTSAAPVRAIACHCGTCKQRTGAAYGVGVYFRDEDVQFNGGERHSFEFHSATSGRWMRNEFCVNCGSTVTWTLEMRPGVRGMSGGCFDDPGWYDIEAHIWTSSARSDMRYPDGMTVCEHALP